MTTIKVIGLITLGNLLDWPGRIWRGLPEWWRRFVKAHIVDDEPRWPGVNRVGIGKE